ncbi:tetratricopeptide repeat protein [Shewanella halifaxensis]|uniref:tetratricopeptide repeat protein n=1 Tax=Shewanella halifaxensis TaxID=271098 RepID=UPI0013A63B89|nr:tetratricopeptide repeat protein [Shewanella halifaxensis]
MNKSVLFVFLMFFSVTLSFANDANDYELTLVQAKQGNAYAAFKVASMLDNGRGVATNKEQAINWYKKSARLGYSQAQSMLGFKYAMGNGVKKDMKSAYAWFDVALKNGHEISEQYKAKAAKELSKSELEVAKDLSAKWFEAYRSPIQQ